MSVPQKPGATDWLHVYLPLGCKNGDNWTPVGGAFLLLDQPMLWLVTATSAITAAGGAPVSTWVRTADGVVLLDVTDSQRRSGLDWIHHPAGLSASLFPADPKFKLKAFTETQCTRVRNLRPLQPAAAIGQLYGADFDPSPARSPAVLDGIVSAVDERSGAVLATAPLLPRNAGAPLLLASPYGGDVTLAGVLLDNSIVHEADPRTLPVRLSRSICVDAALELIRGDDAKTQRARVTASTESANTPNADSTGGDS